jgi:hypothetical protein
MALHWLGRYWAWAGSNIGAMPACGLLALAVGGPATYLLRDRIGRRLAAWLHKHHQPHLSAELAAMEERIKAHIDARHDELTERAPTKGRGT